MTNVVSYWISTSNHNQELPNLFLPRVVSYWISTSNHNGIVGIKNFYSVVSYWISTSNHNEVDHVDFGTRLYLIEFLHQTTTAAPPCNRSFGCILLNFYIKPQPAEPSMNKEAVVSYWISTSNHNGEFVWKFDWVLYLIEFLHQTTTGYMIDMISIRLYLIEFLHQTTTFFASKISHVELYLIEFLHQTTTDNPSLFIRKCCILLNFYIKPQPCWETLISWPCCILLNFYIKPQLAFNTQLGRVVVSYWISTSNHNRGWGWSCRGTLYLIEFLHQTTTSCHIIDFWFGLYLIEFLHQTTTRRSWIRRWAELYLIEFLHQTTTSGRLSVDSAYFAAVWWFPKSAFRSSAKSIWCLFSYFKEQI